jgi:DNA processing protein
MALNKEQILTLTCLKEVGCTGFGYQKVMTLGNHMLDNDLVADSYDQLFDIIKGIKVPAFQKVTLSYLSDASRIAKRVIEESERQSICFVALFDEDYPELLKGTVNEEGKLEPPLLIWYRGNLSITEMPGLAVIGTREPTNEGIAGGQYLASEFAKKGFNIISGLAVGCDTCGHKGALKVGGKTTAILGNGLDHKSIYPPENQDLAEEIVENGGLLLSEYRIGSAVNRFSLVARDRLQSGLAKATLVIQTGENGGTMHAATATLQARKPLYTMLFKDDATNKHEKCLGNALLVKKGARYIKGSDNISEICDNIKNWEPPKDHIFDK